MTATQDGNILNRLTEATIGDAFAAEPARKDPLSAANQRAFTTQEREALTALNTQKLMEQLSFTTDRLQGAMQRIGYLESQMEVLESQVAFLPDFRAKAARCIVLEKENQELKAVIEARNLQLIKREQLLNERNDQVGILEKLLNAYRKHLSMVETDLSRLENSGWVRFCSWFTGISIR